MDTFWLGAIFVAAAAIAGLIWFVCYQQRRLLEQHHREHLETIKQLTDKQQQLAQTHHDEIIRTQGRYHGEAQETIEKQLEHQTQLQKAIADFQLDLQVALKTHGEQANRVREAAVMANLTQLLADATRIKEAAALVLTSMPTSDAAKRFSHLIEQGVAAPAQGTSSSTLASQPTASPNQDTSGFANALFASLKEQDETRRSTEADQAREQA